MKYAECRETIKSGDLLAWDSQGGFQANVVRVFTKSEYSHVGIAWVTGGRVFVVEAVVPRVRIYPLSKTGSFYHIPMNKPLSAKAEAYLLSQVGDSYSKWLAIKTFFKEIKDKDTNVWHCGKLSNLTLKINGYDYPGEFTPSQLVKATLKDGKHIQFVEN